MRATTTSWLVSACVLAVCQAACGSGGGGTTGDGGPDDVQSTCVECVGAEPTDDSGTGDGGADLDAGCPESWYGCPYPDGGPRSGTICYVSNLYEFLCEQHGDCPEMDIKHALAEECANGCHDDYDGLARCMDAVTTCPSAAEGTVIFTFTPVPPPDSVRSLTSFSGTPAIGADGVIYVGDQGARFYALNCDGSQRWLWRCGCMAQAFEGSPAIGSDGTIYIGDDVWYPDYLFALDARGNKKWEYESGGIYGGMDNSPTLGDDGTIYIGQSSSSGYSGSSGAVLALSPEGAMRTGFPVVTGAVVASMAFVDGKVVVAAAQESDENLNPLRAIAPDGTIVWESPLKYIGSSIAVGTGGIIYLTMNEDRYDQNMNHYSASYLAAFNASTGAEVWEVQLSSTSTAAYALSFSVPASPVVGMGPSGDEVYVMLIDGRLAKVVAESGVPTIAFDLTLGYIGRGAPALGDDGYVYAVAREGTEKNSTGTSVYKVSRDGAQVTEIAHWIKEMPSTSLTIAPGGALLFGTEKGKIIAVKTGATGLDATAPWPTFRHDTRNTGNAGTR